MKKNKRDIWLYASIGGLLAVQPFLAECSKLVRASVASVAGALVAVKAKMSKGEPE